MSCLDSGRLPDSDSSWQHTALISQMNPDNSSWSWAWVKNNCQAIMARREAGASRVEADDDSPDHESSFEHGRKIIAKQLCPVSGSTTAATTSCDISSNTNKRKKSEVSKFLDRFSGHNCQAIISRAMLPWSSPPNSSYTDIKSSAVVSSRHHGTKKHDILIPTN